VTAGFGEGSVSLISLTRYQAAVIGSSSGALVHLCAALAVPFLPQTVLVPPVRRCWSAIAPCAGR
jgi:hypothetical protein